MPKTSYQDVYQDNKGQFYYEVSLGTDKITGKRIKRKGRKSQSGKKFESAKEAYAEAVRVKNDFLQTQGYSDYGMTFEQFMNNVYIPHYGRLPCMMCSFSGLGFWIKMVGLMPNPTLPWSSGC